MIESHIRKNRAGEPVWTFKVTGYHDIFRLAWALGHCQVEFLREGMKALRYMRRRMGYARFTEMDRQLTGGKVKQYGWSSERQAD